MRDNVTRPSDLTDLDLERALIALVFTDNANLGLLDGLSPDDLSDPFLGAILAAALDVHEEGLPVTLVTLKSRLEGIRLDDDRTGLELLQSLSFGGVLPSIRQVADRLRDLALRRRMASYLQGMAAAVREENQPINALIADASSRLSDYLSDSNHTARSMFTLHEAAEEFIRDLEHGVDPVEIPTGLTDLDIKTGGWHRGQFVIIAGRPSMGKTALALASMLRTARKGLNAIEKGEPLEKRVGVLFFSLEMTKQQVIARALSDLAYTTPPIPYADMRPGIGDLQKRRIHGAAERMRNLPMLVEPLNGLTMVDIMARTRQVRDEFREQNISLAVVCVDHLLKVRPSNRYKGQPVKELDEISEAMCVLAKQYNVAALGVHQLNRGVESRDNPRPVMSDLRGSGSLEQDADVILFPFRPAYAAERLLEEVTDINERIAAEAELERVRHILELQIAKQRNGPTTALKFWCDMPSNVVRDMANRGT